MAIIVSSPFSLPSVNDGPSLQLMAPAMLVVALMVRILRTLLMLEKTVLVMMTKLALKTMMMMISQW